MRRRTAVVIAAAALALAGVVVAGIVGFPRMPAAGTTTRPVTLPAEFEPYVFNACMPEVDFSTIGVGALGFSSTGSGADLEVRVEDMQSWHVDADRDGVTVSSDNGTPAVGSDVSPGSGAIPIAEELYSCLASYHFAEPHTNTDSSSQLLQLYKYDAQVLWPCLAAHGFDVGDPPTRADFRDSFTVTTVNPFRAVTLTHAQLPRLVAAARACPLRPAYLG